LQICHDGIDVIEDRSPIGQHPPRFRMERCLSWAQFIKYLSQPASAEQM